MHAGQRWGAILGVGLVLAAASSVASADGKYFGSPTLARDPAMPHQRAIVAWRDGIETMVIESAVDADGAALGWIVPIPGELLEVKPVGPGTVATLDACVEPVIVAGTIWSALLPTLAVAFASAILVLVGSCFGLSPKTTRERIALALLPPLVVALGSLLLLPGLAIAGSQPALRESTIRAGIYDVHLLDGTPDAVSTWLATNGFAIDEEAKRRIAAYVSDGWRFAAMRIAPDGKGVQAPHPLLFRAASESPVYPMRLTGVGQEELVLDLFVLADGTANTPELSAMRTWFSDALREDRSKFEYARGAPTLRAEHFPIEFGHPGVLDVAWPGAVLTRLHGRLDATDMTRDVAIAVGPTTPQRARVWDRATFWRGEGATWCLLGTATCLALLAESTRRAIRRRALAVVVVGSALVIGVVGTRAVLAETVPIAYRHRPWDNYRLWRAVSLAKDSSRTTDAILEELRERNGASLEGYDGPFGWSVTESDGTRRVTLIDRHGTPGHYEITLAQDAQ